MTKQLRILIWDLLFGVLFFVGILLWEEAREWLFYQQILYLLGLSICIIYFAWKVFSKGIKIIWRQKDKDK